MGTTCGEARYCQHRKKKEHRRMTGGYTRSEPLALGVSVCHITRVIKVRSVKGGGPPALKQLCQLGIGDARACLSVVRRYTGSNFKMREREGKEKRSWNPFYFLCLKSNRKQHRFCYTLTFPKYSVCTGGLRTESEAEIPAGGKRLTRLSGGTREGPLRSRWR